MNWLDWTIVAAYLIYVVFDGLWKSSKSDRIENYFLAGRSIPWWAVGLSIMATQLSAITLVGTTGQAYASGMRFIQFYFGLPLAMIILSLTAVPFFYRAKVFTAYEYLEKRFDAKTRSLTSFIFLVSRGLSCGVIIAAPSVILSIVLGWDETTTVLVMGASTTLYTMFGGVRAVTWADVKQMVLIVGAVIASLWVIISQLPADVSLAGAFRLVGASGKLQSVDFRFDLNETYTLWSGLLGGLFLMLAYFGCDQSQVQRFLTAKSESEGRTSLLFNGFAKIPLQILILLMGVLVFAVHHFDKPPMIFQRVAEQKALSSPLKTEYEALQARYDTQFEARRQAALQVAQSAADSASVARYRQTQSEFEATRKQAVETVRKGTADPKFNDVNYIFPTYITRNLPPGLVGLLISELTRVITARRAQAATTEESPETAGITNPGLRRAPSNTGEQLPAETGSWMT